MNADREFFLIIVFNFRAMVIVEQTINVEKTLLLGKRRFASIDFLRGLAIFMMLVLHVTYYSLDVDHYLSEINNIALIQFVLLLGLPFFGGLAGLFLMVSAMGNMVSMSRNLEKGKTIEQIVLKQVIGGFLVIFMAMLVEGFIGYNGVIGREIFKYGKPLPVIYHDLLPKGVYRMYHFETIHTIGWAIVLNGIIHGILVKKYDWQKEWKKIERAYILLAVLVLILTPIMWKLATLVVPGYPYRLNPRTGREVQYPQYGVSPWWYYVLDFFLIAIAGEVEPIFPYLAVSFLGSIIGLALAQKKGKVSLKFTRNYFVLGLSMFLVGMVGFFYNVFDYISRNGFDAGINLYILIWEHRYWTSENGVRFAGWLFQFLFLNGFSLMLAILTIRLVEFRGIGPQFGKYSSFIRRFGFIAFTVYTIQFLYYSVTKLVSYMVTGKTDSLLLWPYVIINVILTVALFHVLMLLWEKKGYIGSIEWLLGTISTYVLPVKKANLMDEHAEHWWDRGKLDVEKAFYNVNWINLNHEYQRQKELLLDSKLSLKLSIGGFFLFPLSFIAIFLARHAEKVEGKNKYNQIAFILGIVGVLFLISWVSGLSILNLEMLGISM